jgi:hypothetical protein
MDTVLLVIALICALIGVGICLKRIYGPDDPNYLYDEYK